MAQPLAYIVDKYGYKKAVVSGSAIAGTCLAAVPHMGTPALTAGALACAGAGEGLSGPAINARMVDAVERKDPAQATQAMSVLRASCDVGFSLGAFIVGDLSSTKFGYCTGYETASAMMFLAALVSLARLSNQHH